MSKAVAATVELESYLPGVSTLNNPDLQRFQEHLTPEHRIASTQNTLTIMPNTLMV